MKLLISWAEKLELQFIIISKEKIPATFKRNA